MTTIRKYLHQKLQNQMISAPCHKVIRSGYTELLVSVLQKIWNGGRTNAKMGQIQPLGLLSKSWIGPNGPKE